MSSIHHSQIIEKNRLLVATHNPSKLKRYQQQLQDLPVNLISLADLNLHLEPPAEIGSSTLEIVKQKAKFYFENTQTPCFSNDSGLYFEGVLETEQPGQNVKGIAGATDSMPPEEIYELMIDFYQNLATKYGGNLPGYFLDSYCLFDGQNYLTKEIKRAIILTDKVYKKDLHFPICSLYKIKDKYYHELTEMEMNEFLGQSTKGLKDIIKEWLENQKLELNKEKEVEEVFLNLNENDLQKPKKKYVRAIIYNPKMQKFLFSYFSKIGNGQFGLVGGGVETGETEIESLKREIEEETGLKNYEIVCKLGGSILSPKDSRFDKEDIIKENTGYLVFTTENLNLSNCNLSQNEIKNGFELKWQSSHETKFAEIYSQYQILLDRAIKKINELTDFKK